MVDIQVDCYQYYTKFYSCLKQVLPKYDIKLQIFPAAMDKNRAACEKPAERNGRADIVPHPPITAGSGARSGTENLQDHRKSRRIMELKPDTTPDMAGWGQIPLIQL